MKAFISLLCFCLCSMMSMGQVSYVNKIELDSKDGYSNDPISFSADGFLMRTNKIYSEDNTKRQVTFEWFNTDLAKAGDVQTTLPGRNFSEETYTTNTHTHTFYKGKKSTFTLISVSAPPSLQMTEVTGVLPKKSRVLDMAILGDYAFFKAIVKKEDYIFSVNWKTGEKKLIPINIEGFSRKKTFVKNFQVLQGSKELFVYVKVYTSKKTTDFYVVRLNDQGDKEEIYNLSKNIDRNIVTISASAIGQNTYIFTGTYATKATKSSEGLFFCQAQKSEIDFINFYNFLDLKDFLSYLPERRQAKIVKKKKKKEKKGKEYKLNYRIADHDVILLDDGYLFLGEAFYATYRTETYQTTTMVNGVATPVTQTRTVFDGYQYTHAILAKFDREGNMLWDQSFPMWSAYKPFYVKRFISIAEQEQNSIKMVYSSRSRIHSKSVNFDGTVLQEKESEALETTYEGDKLKYSLPDIKHWYDNYFLAFGTQKIKNKKEKNVKKNRRVYFISKVLFE